MKEMDKVVKVLNWKVPKILDKVSYSVGNIEEIVLDWKDVTKQVAPQIPLITRKGSNLIDDADVVIDSLTKIWPIRLHIKNPKEKILPIDSSE